MKKKCNICKSDNFIYLFCRFDHFFCKCQSCDLIFINPQPSEEVLTKIYSDPNYFPLVNSQQNVNHFSFLKRSSASIHLDNIKNHVNKSFKKINLLEIGPGGGDFLDVAFSQGAQVSGLEFSEKSANLLRKKYKDKFKIYFGELCKIKKKFDLIVMNDVLEHVRDPAGYLKGIHKLLKDDGYLYISVPSLDSISYKIQKTRWVEFKLEHLYYFNDVNLRKLLYKSEFINISTKKDFKVLSLKYIFGHFIKHSSLKYFFKILDLIIPNFLLYKSFKIAASGSSLISKIISKKTHHVDVILPVYNEEKTIDKVIKNVLNKKVENFKLNLVIVESNSKDNTRRIVKKYINNPKVKIIFQSHAKGKGNAVREGIKNSKSEFILIQDGDLEYDINDYDALLRSVVNSSYGFVLGSRHGGSRWKVREFTNEPFLGLIANTAHWILTFLINQLYRTKLTDPFTMYKVFKRSNIEKLHFECDRFDFDYELLLKQIRAGYYPEEINVNYKARSFAEGKKVDIIIEPFRWIYVIFKYRFCKISNE